MTYELHNEVPYRLQQADSGKWIIHNSRDEGLGWTGGFWANREQSGGSFMITFADEAAALEYAQQVFKGW